MGRFAYTPRINDRRESVSAASAGGRFLAPHIATAIFHAASHSTASAGVAEYALTLYSSVGIAICFSKIRAPFAYATLTASVFAGLSCVEKPITMPGYRLPSVSI